MEEKARAGIDAQCRAGPDGERIEDDVGTVGRQRHVGGYLKAAQPSDVLAIGLDED